MAGRVTLREVGVRVLMAGVLVVAAACGTTDEVSSVTDTPTSTVPVCEDGLLPALAALDRATGEYQWLHCSADPAWREVRGATDDVVYFNAAMPDPSAAASEFGQSRALIAVDARSGAELWRIAVTHQDLGWPPGPFAGGGVVVVQVNDEEGAAIVGVDDTTGAVLWRVPEAVYGASEGSVNTPRLVVAPLANTDEVVVLSVPTGLLGLDRASGARLWSNVTVHLGDESGTGVARGPAAVDGSMVLVPSGPKLVAVDIATGAKLWEGQQLHHPVASEGYAVGYVGSGGPSSAQVIVIDATTGDRLWSRPGRESYGDLWAIGEGAVYVNNASDGQFEVVAYELGSGDERWRRAGVSSDPQQVADDGVVLLGGYLEVLSTADGATRWTISPVGPDTPMSGVGHNTNSILVSFNGLPWTD